MEGWEDKKIENKESLTTVGKINFSNTPTKGELFAERRLTMEIDGKETIHNPFVNSPGKKFDQGKLRYSLLLEGMPKGLRKVLEVLEYGAVKYEPHNWQKVDDGINRYKEALMRHIMNLDGGLFAKDPESGLTHLAHIACNALFLLELMKEDK